MRPTLLAALLAAALIAGCGGSDKSAKTTAPAPSSATTTSAIKIKDFLYSPDPSTVKVGDKISVTNEDDAPHTLTARGTPAAFDSDTIKHGQTRTITFTKAGTFKYYCQFHATMSGTITVTQ
jgi:plastocyanin